MLAEIIKKQKEKSDLFYTNKVKVHTEQYNQMVVLKEQIEAVGDGCLVLKIQFAEPTKENISNNYQPCLEVVNIMDAVHIRGTIDELNVSGLGLFRLMGEKHTVKSFFKKIAPYLKKVK